MHCFACFAAAQQTMRVPQDYPTLQSAINAARTGDTVSVGPGTYFENIVLDTKEISVVATDGAAKTTIDGNHLGPVVKITNTQGMNTILSGFTIQNGSPLGSSPGRISVGPAGVLIANAGAHIAASIFQKNAGINIGVINGSLDLSATQIATASTANGSCSLSGGGSLVNPSTGVYLSGTTTAFAAGALPPASTLRNNTIFGDGTACSGIGVQAVNVSPKLVLSNNVLRNNSLGVSLARSPSELLQNLIYDNVGGGVTVATPLAGHPSTDPVTTLVVNNTIVNNLTSPGSSNGTLSDILLTGTVAQVGFRNNILVGTTPHAVVSCETQMPSANDTPLVLEHNDVFNSSGGPTLSGNCAVAGDRPFSRDGNMSLDPRLAGSTDLHVLSGSPVLDAGLNSLDQLPTDFDGNPRVADSTGLGYPVIDLGAYERPASPSTQTPTYLSLAPSQYVISPGNLMVALDVGALRPSGPVPVSTGSVTLFRDGASVGTAAPDSAGHLQFSLLLSTPGVVALTAQYSPSLGLAPASSPLVYVFIANAAVASATLELTAAPSTATVGRPITLTVHLGSSTTSNGVTTAGPVPPGDVTLLEGGNPITTLQPDGSGLATYVVKPSVGQHTYTVSFAGDAGFSSAMATASVTVTAPVATVLTPTITPSSASLGGNVILAAKVAALSGTALPTGTVTFTDGATVLGSAALINGGASLSLPTLSAGLHTIHFSYAPDPAFSASDANAYLTVGGAATTTILTASPASASTIDSIQMSVSVTDSTAVSGGEAPAGSISLFDGTALLVTSPYPTASGPFAFSAALPTPGVHHLLARYMPANGKWLASSSAADVTIVAAPTLTAKLTVLPGSPVSIETALSLNVKVSPAAAIPPGTIYSLYDGSTLVGTGAISPANATASAAIASGQLSVGSHSFYAVLSGPRLAAPVTSNTVDEEVARVDTALALQVMPGPSASAATPLTLLAALTVPSSANTLPFSGAIVFYDGGAVLGAASLTTDGHASLSSTILSTGSHQLSATYAGTSVLGPATSASVTEQISLNPTETSLSLSPVAPLAFSQIVLRAHVSSASGSVAINTQACPAVCSAISVTFFADTASGRITLGSAAVDTTGSAVLTTALPAGSYNVVAAFSGTPFFAQSMSASASLTVAPLGTNLSLTASPDPLYQQQAVTLAAIVTAPGAPPTALTGDVTFSEGSAILGSSPLASAGAFVYKPASVGAHTVTATFSGNASLAGSNSSVTVTVLPSDFSLSLKDPTLTIQMEHHAPTSVQVVTTGPLADLVDLSCANLPENAHCSFSPSMLDLTQTNASAGTLTLDTDALLNYADGNSRAYGPFQRGHSGDIGGLVAVLALTLPTTLLAGALRLRRRGAGEGASWLRNLDLLAVLLAVGTIFNSSGCSGASPGHVAPGTYAVTVTGHARATGITHSTTLTLIVTP